MRLISKEGILLWDDPDKELMKAILDELREEKELLEKLLERVNKVIKKLEKQER